MELATGSADDAVILKEFRLNILKSDPSDSGLGGCDNFVLRSAREMQGVSVRVPINWETRLFKQPTRRITSLFF